MRTPAISLSGFLAALAFSTAQAEPAEDTRDKLPQTKDGNFVLYVSNQSFAVNPVDITVRIDGKQAVRGDFDVKGGSIAQHNWKRHVFKLSPGKHKLHVESRKGAANLDKEFEVAKKHWAVVNYWYYPKSHYNPTPKHFSFKIQNTRIMFK